MTDTHYPEVKRIHREYSKVTVDHGGFDAALVLKVWDRENITATEIRIAVEDLPDFTRDVASHVSYALREAANRLAAGHCETCKNRRLIDTTRHGQPWSQACPDCADRRALNGLAMAPQIGDTLVEADEHVEP